MSGISIAVRACFFSLSSWIDNLRAHLTLFVLYTLDILCGLIGLALPLRKKAAEEPGSDVVPLKLVIMSATLRVDDFVSNKKLFPLSTPFVVRIPGKTFPITIHYSKLTELENYGKHLT